MLTLNGYPNERWNTLLERARSEELHAYPHSKNETDGVTEYTFQSINPSSSHRTYLQTIRVSPDNHIHGHCTCEACKFRSLCKHLALAVQKLGLLGETEATA